MYLSTVSSISIGTGQTNYSLWHGFEQSPKMVKTLTANNKKEAAIELLKQRVDILNTEFVRKKQASNALI